MRVSGYPTSTSNAATLYGLVSGASRQLLAAVFQQSGGMWVMDSTTLVVDPTAHRVGIGTSTPAHVCHVYAASGDAALMIEAATTGAASAYARFKRSTTGGAREYWVGPGIMGNAAFVLYDFTGTTRRYELDTAGRHGFGRTPAANTMEVEGNASKTASGDWLANSDARIKRDVRAIEGALAKLEACNPVEFRYTETYRAAHPSIPDRPHLGVVAQEFREVFPDYVYDAGERVPGEAEDAPNMLQVDTFPLTIVTAAAVKELAAIVRAQAAEIAALRRHIGMAPPGLPGAR